MKVRYTPRARRDLDAILAYIDQRSPSGAQNVKRALQRTIELIAEHPQAGRMWSEHQIRMVPVGGYPYLVFWTVQNREVSLLHIRHVAKMPWLHPK